MVANLSVWRDEVLKVPIGALFRSAGRWSAFRVSEGRAELVPVEVGRMSDTHAQVLAGLAQGDIVVLYPSDVIESGTEVAPRVTEAR